MKINTIEDFVPIWINFEFCFREYVLRDLKIFKQNIYFR